MIIRPIFSETSNSHKHIRHILTPCYKHVSYNKRTCAWLVQEESATPNTANNSIYCSENVFIDRIISMRMWPACLPYMNRGSFYL